MFLNKTNLMKIDYEYNFVKEHKLNENSSNNHVLFITLSFGFCKCFLFV
jgi:hypothetical protein